MTTSPTGARPQPDQLLLDIAEYAHNFEISSELALSTARVALFDALGCAMEALDYPECVKLLGPPVPGVTVALRARGEGIRHQRLLAACRT